MAVRVLVPTRKDATSTTFNMNKYIILLLVVCLVSVNAFVKRDAPETTDTKNSDLVADVTKKIQEGLKQAAESINPESIKKAFDDTVNTITKAINDLNPAEAPKA